MSGVLLAGGGTGGHLYPALAIGGALQSLRPALQVHYLGARRGVEAHVLPDRGVPHTLLPLEPLRRDRPWGNWRLVPSTLRSVLALRRLFARLRPTLFVGTGGYASALAGAWALASGVPVAIQEQNAYPGLTQRLLSRYARQVHLGFPEARAHLRVGRGTVVYALGNPIRPPDPALDRSLCREALGLQRDGTVVLVVGGSQGAEAVNRVVVEVVERVAEGSLAALPLQLLWATGPAHLEAVRARLAGRASDWVRVTGYIDDMPRALAAADLAVSRAGAMTTAELMAWGIPSVLVPLPTSAADHQRHNAEALAAAGAAVLLPQAELTPERLWSQLGALAGDTPRRAAMADRARQRGNPDAARQVAARLLELLEES
jgi:UDP-N-acetylglucosamine--N-acetylmuramyl-(pentapeptide) pyrophosphoryl-undecaprenol N-acetylglucosamine transferase